MATACPAFLLPKAAWLYGVISPLRWPTLFSTSSSKTCPKRCRFHLHYNTYMQRKQALKECVKFCTAHAWSCCKCNYCTGFIIQLLQGGHNGVSTVYNENKNLQFWYFWRNPKNNLDGQDRQQGLNLLHIYGQPKGYFGYKGVVVRMRALFCQNV